MRENLREYRGTASQVAAVMRLDEELPNAPFGGKDNWPFKIVGANGEILWALNYNPRDLLVEAGASFDITHGFYGATYFLLVGLNDHEIIRDMITMRSLAALECE